jgi:hypothetical protein
MRKAFPTSTKNPGVLLAILLLLGLYAISRSNYLLFHSLAEIFSIVVACSIFMIVWNSRRFIENSYFILIGIAYLFVGFMDLLHTLAYTGMGVFAESDTNLPTQLWIATPFWLAERSDQSFCFPPMRLCSSLCFAPYFLGVSFRIVLQRVKA